jgi:hypothetical protein
LSIFFPSNAICRVRISLHNWIVSLEKLWHGEWTEETRSNYTRMKHGRRKTDDELSSLLGKIDGSLVVKAHADANRYLASFLFLKRL